MSLNKVYSQQGGAFLTVDPTSQSRTAKCDYHEQQIRMRT